MKQDNYISFSIVFGFFIGLAMSIIKFNSPELIILGTIVGTMIIYLIALFCASFYMMFSDNEASKLNIKKLDSTLDMYLNDLDKSEKETLYIRNYIKHSLNTLNQDKEE